MNANDGKKNSKKIEDDLAPIPTLSKLVLIIVPKPNAKGTAGKENMHGINLFGTSHRHFRHEPAASA